MKLSNGFTRLVPTVSMFVLYGLSLVPMVGALKQMEVSTVYAIWSAVGTAVVATLGIVLFHEPASALKVASIALIIVGVVCLNLSTRPAPRPIAENRSRPGIGGGASSQMLKPDVEFSLTGNSTVNSVAPYAGTLKSVARSN